MQNNKAPAADGSPKEFDPTFWAELNGPLLEMYNECLQLGSLPFLFYLKKVGKKILKTGAPLHSLVLIVRF